MADNFYEIKDQAGHLFCVSIEDWENKILPSLVEGECKITRVCEILDDGSIVAKPYK